MSKLLGSLMGLTLGAMCLTGPALAEEKGTDYLALSAAYYDINDNNDAGEARLEYRSGERFWVFQPFGGVMATTDEAFHAYAGVLVDLELGNGFYLTPSFAPGYYHDGDGKDLGYDLQFRSQVELAYQFENKVRLGVSINHISNASLSENNPGTESLALTVAIPFGN